MLKGKNKRLRLNGIPTALVAGRPEAQVQSEQPTYPVEMNTRPHDNTSLFGDDFDYGGNGINYNDDNEANSQPSNAYHASRRGFMGRFATHFDNLISSYCDQITPNFRACICSSYNCIAIGIFRCGTCRSSHAPSVFCDAHATAHMKENFAHQLHDKDDNKLEMKRKVIKCCDVAKTTRYVKLHVADGWEEIDLRICPQHQAFTSIINIGFMPDDPEKPSKHVVDY